jgi:hypothetical protein
MNNLTSLNGTWNLSGGEHKLTTEIPGDFHYALLKANIIKDPYVGYNEQDCLCVGRTDWSIEREFEYKKIEGIHLNDEYLPLAWPDFSLLYYISNSLNNENYYPKEVLNDLTIVEREE